ncbi:MAG: peptidylprolyl isomerase [Nitrospiraceae bacterium]|nr:MAG: peptidylprolyl isomerase [Nitrospiraceae bacterium]
MLEIMAIITAVVISTVMQPPRCFGKTAQEQALQEREVIARVNGHPLYQDQVRPLVEKEMEAFRKYGARSINPATLDRLRKKALDTVIENELLRQESEKVTVPDIDVKVEGAFAELKKKHPSEDVFRERLKTAGMTENAVRESLRVSVRLEEYMKIQGIRNPDISEKEIREFYESSPRTFVREEMVKVRHILIKADAGSGEAGKEAARTGTEAIRDEIMKGKDFSEAAKEHSRDAYAVRGGDLGYIKRGFMPEEFDAAAFALGIGEVSNVIETEHGFHIIRVEDRRPGGRVPYEEVRDFIEKYLRERASKKKFAGHVDELKKRAVIEIPETEGKGNGGIP